MTRVTPLMLAKQASVWEDFYSYGITQSKNGTSLMPALYCLFLSLEMRLKAYLILLDSTYASPQKLREISHDFKKIHNILTALAPVQVINQIKAALQAYNLLENHINDLRYPETPRGYELDQDLETGNHKLKAIFALLDFEIKNGFTEWLRKNP